MSLMDYQTRIDFVMKKTVPRDTIKAWKLKAKRQSSNGYEYAYEVPTGYSINDLETQLDALYASCGSVVELEDRAGIVIIKVLTDDFPLEIPYQDDFLNLTKEREIVLGFDRSGNPVTHHFRVPHMMIAGMSGYGKTDLIRWILFQLVSRFTPDQLEINIIDMKGFSFMPFRNVPHVNVVRDLNGALDVLRHGKQLMKDRAKQVWESNDRNLTKTFKWHLVVIDEASQIAPHLMRTKAERDIALECDEYAAAISGIGREANVGLFYCTQRPDATVINPLVKANMDAVFCFKTKTELNSMIVLDKAGAEKLPHKKPGRGYYATDELIEIQVPFIGIDDKWNELLKPYQVKMNDNFYLKEMDVHDNQEGTKEGEDPSHDARPSNRIDGTNLNLLQGDWISTETGIGVPPNNGKGKTNRGKETGNRQTESVASDIRWTFPVESEKASPPSKQFKD